MDAIETTNLHEDDTYLEHLKVLVSRRFSISHLALGPLFTTLGPTRHRVCAFLRRLLSTPFDSRFPRHHRDISASTERKSCSGSAFFAEYRGDAAECGAPSGIVCGRLKSSWRRRAGQMVAEDAARPTGAAEYCPALRPRDRRCCPALRPRDRRCCPALRPRDRRCCPALSPRDRRCCPALRPRDRLSDPADGDRLSPRPQTPAPVCAVQSV